MKKFTLLFSVVLVAFVVFALAAPFDAEAKSIGKRFRGNSYSGTWELTYDTCAPENIGNTGNLILSQIKIKRKGKIKKGTKIYFDNADIGIKGRIYKKNKKYRVRFNYPRKDGAFAGQIRGRIKQKSLKGKYDHFYEGCEWGGTFDMYRQYN